MLEEWTEGLWFYTEHRPTTTDSGCHSNVSILKHPYLGVCSLGTPPSGTNTKIMSLEPWWVSQAADSENNFSLLDIFVEMQFARSKTTHDYLSHNADHSRSVFLCGRWGYNWWNQRASHTLTSHKQSSCFLVSCLLKPNFIWCTSEWIQEEVWGFIDDTVICVSFWLHFFFAKVARLRYCHSNALILLFHSIF